MLGQYGLDAILAQALPTHTKLGLMAAVPEIPAGLRDNVAKLQKPLAAILVGKEIPCVVQAALGESGYVTVEDSTAGTPLRTPGRTVLVI